MISTAGGMHAGSDAARKQRLDDMVGEGYLVVEQAKYALPGHVAEPTYRLTDKGRELLAT